MNMTANAATICCVAVGHLVSKLRDYGAEAYAQGSWTRTTEGAASIHGRFRNLVLVTYRY